MGKLLFTAGEAGINSTRMDINKILKSDYLDILFDGRNKTYGGYELRKKYPARARKAAALLFGGALMLSAYPIIAAIFSKEMVRAVPVSKEIVRLREVPVDNTPPEPLPTRPQPPAPAKPVSKWADPKIEKNEAVKEADKLVETPDEKVAISFQTSDGNKDGIDRNDIVDRAGGDQVETTPPPEPIATVVDQRPDFEDLQGYLERNLRYPDDARENGREGKAVLRFVVNEDGSISGTEVLRTAGYASLDAEAVRVLSGMPRWKPGRLQGKKVKVYFTLPITFKLD